MITVEDLRNSLRLQLGALVELYERDAGRIRAPRRAAKTSVPATACASAIGAGAETAAEAGHAARIESCLVDFDAALRAALRALAQNVELQRCLLQGALEAVAEGGAPAET